MICTSLYIAYDVINCQEVRFFSTIFGACMRDESVIHRAPCLFWHLKNEDLI